MIQLFKFNLPAFVILPENVWNRAFYFIKFFWDDLPKIFVFLKKKFLSKTVLANFKKKFECKIRSLICASAQFLSLFLPYPFLYSLQKMCGEFLTHIFDFFNTFPKNYPPKPEFLISNEKVGRGKLPCRSRHTQIFKRKVMALGKKNKISIA